MQLCSLCLTNFGMIWLDSLFGTVMLTMGVRATRMRNNTLLETGIGSEKATTISDALKSNTTLATLDVSCEQQLWGIVTT